MQLPGISPTIPATEAPTDLSRARLATVVGNQIMSVPAEGIGASFGFQPSDAALTSFAGVSWVAGDILYFSGVDTAARLAKGTANQQLRMNAGATAPEWFTPAGLDAALNSIAGVSWIAGDIGYWSGVDTAARLAKGTAGQVLAMNAGATAPEWATPAFAKPMYESGLSAITSAGTLTLAHGLGGIPTFIFPYFICVTASQGYAVGDIIPMNPARFVIVPDATNLFIRFENTTASYGYYNKTTGAFGNLVAARWNFGVRAGL